MIVSFRDKSTKAIYDGRATKAARKRLPTNLWKKAQRRIDQLRQVTRLDQLTVPPGNELKRLRGDRKGQYSIRINMQYRICFFWTDRGPSEVEIVDYH